MSQDLLWEAGAMLKKATFAIALIVFSISFGYVVSIAQKPGSPITVDGIGLAEFRGYDAWQLIAPSQPASGLKAILGNPAMIKAFKEGSVTADKEVPDGAMMAKITWSTRDSADAPGAAMVPDTLRRVQFMRKDSSRFPETDGWGYAQFDYNGTTKTFSAFGTGASFMKSGCHQCHMRVRARDFVFTDYAAR
jgi:hypothetical protein